MKLGCAGYEPISGNDYRPDEKDLPNICKTNGANPDVWADDNTTYPSDADKYWYYMGYAHPVDWVKLTVDVKAAGKYYVSSYWASAGDMWGLSIWFNDGTGTPDPQRPKDGINKTGLIEMAGTSDYHKWKKYPNFATVDLRSCRRQRAPQESRPVAAAPSRARCRQPAFCLDAPTRRCSPLRGCAPAVFPKAVLARWVTWVAKELAAPTWARAARGRGRPALCVTGNQCAIASSFIRGATRARLREAFARAHDVRRSMRYRSFRTTAAEPDRGRPVASHCRRPSRWGQW